MRRTRPRSSLLRSEGSERTSYSPPTEFGSQGLRLVDPGAAAGARVVLRCFGPFELLIEGVPVRARAFSRRAALTLLKILCLQAGKPIHRARLIEWLWPGCEETTGLNRLHGVVHALRAVLEPEGGAGGWRHVQSEGPCYCLVPDEAIWLDLLTFREALERARTLGRDAAAPAGPRIAALEAAVAVYRGDLFEAEPYAEWCDGEREVLKEAFVEALAQLAALHEGAARPQHAVPCLRRALRHDPFREDLRGTLIALLLRLKRPHEARAQCLECLRLLREEPGLQPTAELRDFCRELGVALS